MRQHDNAGTATASVHWHMGVNLPEAAEAERRNVPVKL